MFSSRFWAVTVISSSTTGVSSSATAASAAGEAGEAGGLVGSGAWLKPAPARARQSATANQAAEPLRDGAMNMFLLLG